MLYTERPLDDDIREQRTSGHRRHHREAHQPTFRQSQAPGRHTRRTTFWRARRHPRHDHWRTPGTSSSSPVQYDTGHALTRIYHRSMRSSDLSTSHKSSSSCQRTAASTSLTISSGLCRVKRHIQTRAMPPIPDGPFQVSTAANYHE